MPVLPANSGGRLGARGLRQPCLLQVTGTPRRLRWTRTVRADVTARRRISCRELRPLHTRRSHCTLCIRAWWPRRSVWGEQRPFLGSADVRTQKRPPTGHLPDRPRACASLDVCRGLHSSRGSELRDGCGRRREGRAVPCVAVGGRRLKLSAYLCAGHLRERAQRRGFAASLSRFQKFPFAA